jgi:hypothetical protein
MEEHPTLAKVGYYNKELYMNDGGKGCKPRPFSVTQEEYDNRWNLIFQRDQKTEAEKFDEKVVMKNEYFELDEDKE